MPLHLRTICVCGMPADIQWVLPFARFDIIYHIDAFGSLFSRARRIVHINAGGSRFCIYNQ